MLKRKRESHKVVFSDLKEGDYLSRCIYYKVQKKNGDKVVLMNENEFPLECTSGIPEKEMYSASQVNATHKVSRTELIDILMSSGGTIFTVEFLKQTKPEEVSQQLSAAISSLPAMTPLQLKKFCKEKLLQGEARSLIGYLIAAEPTLGRSRVCDIEVPHGQFAERLVDHRTLKSIIVKGVKYTV